MFCCFPHGEICFSFLLKAFKGICEKTNQNVNRLRPKFVLEKERIEKMEKQTFCQFLNVRKVIKVSQFATDFFAPNFFAPLFKKVIFWSSYCFLLIGIERLKVISLNIYYVLRVRLFLSQVWHFSILTQNNIMDRWC